MKRFWMLTGLMACLITSGQAGELSLPAETANWSVVKMIQAGREAMASGDRAKARLFAEASVARDSGYAGGWTLLGNVRLQAGETNAAIQAFRTAVLISPQDPVSNRALGWLLWDADRDRALTNLDIVVQAGQGWDRDILVRQVLALLAESGQQSKALELFKRWKPGFTMEELGVTLFTSGRRLAAQPFLGAVWEQNENRPAIGLYLACSDARSGRGGRVVEYLKAYLQNAPDSIPPEQAELFWDSVLGLKQQASLQDVWGKIRQRYPAEPDKRRALSRRFEEAASQIRRRGDVETAREFYHQAVILDPEQACWADWALLEERVSDGGPVREQLKALLPNVSDPVIRAGIAGRLAHYEGAFDAAVAEYRRSLVAKPNQVTIRLFLVRDLLAGGKQEEARREILAIDAMNEKLAPMDRANMAHFWLEVGDVLRALALDRTLLVKKSRESAAENDFEGALRMAVMAVTNDAVNAEAWKQMWVAHSRLQHYAEARLALQRAASLKADDAEVYQELGWALWLLGEREGARDSWEKVFVLGVADRARFARQVVGRMAEDGQKDWALELHAKWLPGVSPLDSGLEFFRVGRMQAAEPFLDRAWDEGENRAITGLYLGRVRSMNGVFLGTPAYFMPYISSCLSTAAPAEVAMVVDGLRVCSGVEGAGAVLNALAGALSRPKDQAMVTDVYVTYAREEEGRGHFAPALDFYEKALTRDPDWPVWPAAWSLANRLGEAMRGMALLSNVLSRAKTVAIRSGVSAKLAEVGGNYKAAQVGYRASLESDPDQADIHGDLFEVSLTLGDYAQARLEAEWMARQIAVGQVRLREALAVMWGRLGEDSKAVDLWQFLHLANPDVTYYGTEMAMAQYRTGRGDEAVETLKESVGRTPTQLGYELLSQILATLGRFEEAAEWARRGLAAYSSPVLRRTRAESLDDAGSQGGSTSLVVSAQAAVADDPGSGSLVHLTGRALEVAGRGKEAEALYEACLVRNPEFVPGLVSLRDYQIVAGDPRLALPYAERLAALRPWDDDAIRKYAMSLAEADGFSRAIRVLEPLAGRNEEKVTAILLYPNPTAFNYSGMNTVSQMVSHVARLATEGYRFVDSVPCREQAKKSVMIIVMDPDAAVVEALDAALQSCKGCAVMMVGPDGLRSAVPRKTTPQRLRELRQSGRWQIGLFFPDQNPVPVRPDGVKGNPFTHRIRVKDAPESMASMTNRVGGVLAASASVLGTEAPRLCYYPGGDYGQLSLDTDPLVVSALSNLVGKVFDAAFCRDDNGFISGEEDPLRLPAKAVPASWGSQSLADHLKQANPVVRARLELAKLFYWHGQSEAAAHWFRKAREAGANPFETTFNEAANAAMAGDIPVALQKAREAVVLAPADDTRPARLLEKAVEMRRPTASVQGGAWRDNEDRRYWEAGGEAQGPVTDALRWNAVMSRHEWKRKGLGSEEGVQAGIGFVSYVAPEVWLEAGLQEWIMDSLPDITGWQTRLHLPNPALHGHVELTSRRDMMETLEALRKGITARREGLETYSRVYDFWDCFVNAAYTERSDDNNTWWVDGRIIRRIKETTYLGAGYAWRLADSTDKVAEYWSPEQLQQHQLYGALQATGLKWSGQVSGQAGYAKERDTDWRFVWGTRAAAGYNFTSRLSAGADIGYQGGPIYDRTTVDAFISLRW